jgi:hypothetical protein
LGGSSLLQHAWNFWKRRTSESHEEIVELDCPVRSMRALAGVCCRACRHTITRNHQPIAGASVAFASNTYE